MMGEANALEYAIQLERDGQAFYTEAARSTKNPLGKSMFESLAADERRHEEVLRGIAQKMDVSLGGDMPKPRLVTLFKTLGEELKKQLDAEADDSQVILKAIDMEKASVELYTKQADQTTAERERSIYARLVQEEREHVDILQSTLRYLNDTGHWFLWDEQAILDGG